MSKRKEFCLNKMQTKNLQHKGGDKKMKTTPYVFSIKQ